MAGELLRESVFGLHLVADDLDTPLAILHGIPFSDQTLAKLYWGGLRFCRNLEAPCPLRYNAAQSVGRKQRRRAARGAHDGCIPQAQAIGLLKINGGFYLLLEEGSVRKCFIVTNGPTFLFWMISVALESAFAHRLTVVRRLLAVGQIRFGALLLFGEQRFPIAP